MSEYQYYEFQAIERPLTKEDRAALREITSRAEITSTSLINQYHYGSFKGNPAELVEKYFDAFVYYANWGSRQLTLRVPRSSIVPEDIEQYLVGDEVSVRYTSTHAIIDLNLWLDAGGSYDDDSDGNIVGSPMGSLARIREALMSGDMRALYLAWLASLPTDGGDWGDEDVEPPVPPGLKDVTPSLETLANFFLLDRDLLEIASEASGSLDSDEDEAPRLRAWIQSLPDEEKDQILLDCLRRDATHPGPALRTKFLAQQSGTRAAVNQASGAPRRRISELMAGLQRRREEYERLQRENAQREAEKIAREKAAERERHLKSMEGQESRYWRMADVAVATKTPKQYDRAVEIIRDLFELAARTDQIQESRTRVRELRQKHSKKENFLRKLDAAGIPWH